MELYGDFLNDTCNIDMKSFTKPVCAIGLTGLSPSTFVWGDLNKQLYSLTWITVCHYVADRIKRNKGAEIHLQFMVSHE